MTTLHHCCSSCTGCQCQNEWHSNSASWCIAVCMASALLTSRKTSSSCPRFNLASDCARPPVPTSWFLPHAGLHLATEHSQSQELECGTHCRPVSPPHHLCPHSGDSCRHFFSSDNGVNNTNYCVVVLKCLALSTTLILTNWTELNWFLAAWDPRLLSWQINSLSLSKQDVHNLEHIQWRAAQFVTVITAALPQSPVLVSSNGHFCVNCPDVEETGVCCHVYWTFLV